MISPIPSVFRYDEEIQGAYSALVEVRQDPIYTLVAF